MSSLSLPPNPSLFSCSFSISQGGCCLCLDSPENRACCKSLHANTSEEVQPQKHQVGGKVKQGWRRSKVRGRVGAQSTFGEVV